jgi:hypothetical protein
MVSLVEELQAEALTPGVAASDLLRKALVVATKLNLQEIREWIRSELHGYAQDQPVPAYREVRGQVMMQNPVRGWVPIGFQTSEVERQYCVRPVHNEIARVETFAEGAEMLAFHYPPEIDEYIQEATGFKPSCHPSP